MTNKEIDKFQQDIYDTYVDKCKKDEFTYIKIEEFKVILKHTSDILMYMLNTKKSKSPYISVEIDANMQIYAKIENSNLVINVWNKKEYNILTGTKNGTTQASI